MLDALIITMVNNGESTVAMRKLYSSLTNIKGADRGLENVIVFPATTPQTAVMDFTRMVRATVDIDVDLSSLIVGNDVYSLRNFFRWTWPIDQHQERLDIETGLYLKPYAATDPEKVIACTISHMRAWLYCIKHDKDIVIFEHDAVQTRSFDYSKLTRKSPQFGIVSLNSPRRATRRAAAFHETLSQQYIKDPKQFLYPVPSVNTSNDPPLPQGLPGNSAYVIQPWAARKLLEKTIEIGMWPNDALICKEFFPWIKSAFPYVTEVQGTKSTTTS